MRRMYSEQELTNVIKQVVGGMIEDGDFTEVIDEEVDNLIESGQIENLKPIYFHPISIIKRTGDGALYNLGFTILNNDATPFTFETFTQFIDNLYTSIGGVVRMICTGFYSGSSKSGAVSVLAKVNPSNIQIVLGDSGTPSNYVQVSSWANLFGTPEEFTDGVNKIN